MTRIKICGINTLDAMEAAASAGAHYVVLVFVNSSPRYIDIEYARHLTGHVQTSVKSVGLFKDANDLFIQNILHRVPLNMLQLHGAEDPTRVKHIKEKFGLPVMKAIPIADETDLEAIDAYKNVVDWFLFDTKLPDGRSGGSGHAFDWSLLKGLEVKKPWMLAGGLNADNIAEALAVLSPDAVDVSSGVEASPGQKNAAKIKRFIQTVKSA